MPPDSLLPSDTDRRTLAFLRIWLTPGVGPRHAHRLLQAVGDPAIVASISPKELISKGLEENVARALLAPAAADRAREEMARAASLGTRILDICHPDYPSLLREIADPPLVLYVRGKRWDTESPHIALVGTRKPSPYGVNCAERIGRDLAERGAVVVSGLARGIDTAAHRGALGSGRTVAVLGTGVDRIYPAENRSIAEFVIESGALISEFPFGTLPLPQNFPRRNRILAGMTLGTVVVEAAERSGSLITARLALEANREVFAVPGPIYSLKSQGPHQLIREGACLVTGWQDIARELAPRVELAPPDAGVHAAETVLPPRQLELLGMLSFSGDLPIDALLAKTAAPPTEVYAALLDLELRGLVRRLSGDRYIRNAMARPE